MAITMMFVNSIKLAFSTRYNYNNAVGFIASNTPIYAK